MNLTFQELMEELYNVDEVTLLEMLDITSEELVNTFRDKVEENQEDLQQFVIDNNKGYNTYDYSNN